jgi:hypothetical protein
VASRSEYITALAELVVETGANVRPGQIVALSSEPGKEELTRAIATAAYERGALFVDLSIFDPYLKRERSMPTPTPSVSCRRGTATVSSPSARPAPLGSTCRAPLTRT